MFNKLPRNLRELPRFVEICDGISTKSWDVAMFIKEIYNICKYKRCTHNIGYDCKWVKQITQTVIDYVGWTNASGPRVKCYI